jgi:hypothetical protein
MSTLSIEAQAFEQQKAERNLREAAASRGTVYLVKQGLSWVADWSKTDRADEVFGLFGSHLIPTAFTRDMHPSDVQERISDLNPDYAVEVF